MQIIPVIDILDGVVVHGRAGERESYRPIQSQLVDSVKPLRVLTALQKKSNSQTGYVADLNGLMNRGVQAKVLGQLADTEMDLMIDAGIRSPEDVDRLPVGRHLRPVLASETVPSEKILRQIVASHPYHRFVFSFDLIDDRLRSPEEKWAARSLVDLARIVWDLGIHDWIILDVRSVGMTTGPTTLARCQQLKAEFPMAQLTTGGGIRNIGDLRLLEKSGVSCALLATALHDGKITESEIRSLAAC